MINGKLKNNQHLIRQQFNYSLDRTVYFCLASKIQYYLIYSIVLLLKFLEKQYRTFYNQKMSVYIFSSKKKAEFKTLLQSYINSCQRCDLTLKTLVLNLSQSVQIQNIFLKAIPSQSSFFETLKWLMVAHKCIIDDKVKRQTIQAWLQKIKPKNNSDLDKITGEKLIIPYQMYLKKRCVKLEFGFTKKDQLFYLFNLLNMSVGFIDYFITLSRYYLQKNSYLVDFSILLAIDTRNIYESISKKIGTELSNLEQDLQKTHEKMYLVFYNCYFYKYTTKYAPKWISEIKDRKREQKEIMLANQLKQKNRNRKLDMSFNENAEVSQFAHRKNVSFGVQLSNNIDLNRSRLQVIKDMEKIVELMDIQ